MMFPKPKTVRLHGDKLRALNHEIFERDNYHCVICGAYVPDSNKFHHEPCGSGNKSDEINKGVVLCYDCHQQRHFGSDTQAAKLVINKYLDSIYD